MLAIPWYLIQQPGGKWLNATMVAAVTFLSLFWGLYAGTLVDRYNRKSIFLTLQSIDGSLLLGAAAIGFSLGYMPLVAIIGVYLLTIFTYNVHYPNLYAFVQELFEPAFYAKVNSAIEIQGQTTNFLGMMVGGILLSGTGDIGWWPEAWQFASWPLEQIFLLDGSTYVLGAFLIRMIPYTPSKNKRIDKGAVFDRLRQGYMYLQDHRSLFVFGLASYVVFFSLLVMVQVAAPVYVNDYLQKPAYILSSFKGIYALGAVSAGLIGLSSFIRRYNLIRQVTFLVGSAGILYLGLALQESVGFLLFAAYFLGIANAGTRILRITYLVRLVPNYIIGRVNSIFAVLNVMMRVSFISLLATPFFADDANGGNIVYAMLLLGLVMFTAVGFLLKFFPRFDQSAARE